MEPGLYTVQEIMDALEFNFDEAMGDNVDYRRVKIGGLGFDYLDQKLRIPETATTIEITLDGEVAASAKVSQPK